VYEAESRVPEELEGGVDEETTEANYGILGSSLLAFICASDYLCCRKE
jgi:hypothetical protein